MSCALILGFCKKVCISSEPHASDSAAMLLIHSELVCVNWCVEVQSSKVEENGLPNKIKRRGFWSLQFVEVNKKVS